MTYQLQILILKATAFRSTSISITTNEQHQGTGVKNLEWWCWDSRMEVNSSKYKLFVVKGSRQPWWRKAKLNHCTKNQTLTVTSNVTWNENCEGHESTQSTVPAQVEHLHKMQYSNKLYSTLMLVMSRRLLPTARKHGSQTKRRCRTENIQIMTTRWILGSTL